MDNATLHALACQIAAHTFLTFDDDISPTQAFKLFSGNPTVSQSIWLEPPYEHISPYVIAREMNDLKDDIVNSVQKERYNPSSRASICR